MYVYVFICLFFFFKQKTAYEMRISDWSSDVCSSDLHAIDLGLVSSTFRVILKPGHDIGVEPKCDRLLDGLVKARSARMQPSLRGSLMSIDSIDLIIRQ